MGLPIPNQSCLCPLARSPSRVPQLGLEVFIVFLSVLNEVGSWLPSLLFRKVCMRQRAPGVLLVCLGKWIPPQLRCRMGLNTSNFLTAQMPSGYWGVACSCFTAGCLQVWLWFPSRSVWVTPEVLSVLQGRGKGAAISCRGFNPAAGCVEPFRKQTGVTAHALNVLWSSSSCTRALRGHIPDFRTSQFSRLHQNERVSI